MRSEGRLQRALAIRHLGGTLDAASALAAPSETRAPISDIKLFFLTFAGGFLFTTIFIG